MRHLKSGRALGVKPAHRRAMLRNLVTSVLEHQKITTTLARAKELRGPLDKMITLGKQGDLAARRRALRYVKSKDAMKNLFGDFAERYADRHGGYSRIIALGERRGDGALMALVVLVDGPVDPFGGEAKPTRKKRGGGKQAKPVLEQVAAEVAKPAVEEKPAEGEAHADAPVGEPKA
ncbi:MAG: 50S ribosomal protein L17 [Candidatus Lambdaproteobacteria bacterium]|nr:50S ribosomal protein L17 [Candidatus Lambdaproteobacteria bacterium]